jgi:hypothetical protein
MADRRGKLQSAAAGVLLAATVVLAAAPARAQYNVLETRDLRLVYQGATLGFIAPYTVQCFENSLRFYEHVLPYVPTEKVNLFLDDYADYMNAGVWGSPRSSMSMHIAPASFVYETGPANERINFAMNHELAHVVTLDQAAGMDPVYRALMGGKVRESAEDPETILYGYLTLPRRAAPRWHREGTAVFFETWMSGGLGRAQGPYDEMVFRAMVRDSAHFYDPLGLESQGTKVDFQVGVNAYLYGTRFMSYMAWRESPEKLVQWVSRAPGSKAYFASQFKHVYGEPLNRAWNEWIEWEHGFQRANLDSVHLHPTTPYRDLSRSALGSVSRAFLDSTSHQLFVGLDYPGTVAYVGAIPLQGGAIRNLHEVKGPALYSVCSLAWDPEARTLFYTTDNNDWRDLVQLDPASGHTHVLMTDARIGDLAFDRQDRSLWGVRHFNGISTIVRLKPPYTDYSRVASLPYGRDMYDLDISPDGTLLSASVAGITGRQSLRLFHVAALAKGDTTSRLLYDFGSSIPTGFVFSADGRRLYGSSYYTGVSNIFRYDLAADSMDVVSNTETGFFRPVPLGGDSLVVFRYTGRGFVPAEIEGRALDDVSAITFLGHELVEKYPVLKSWKVPSPASVNVDSVVVFHGDYRPLRRIGLASLYPIVEGYKVYSSFGMRMNLSDPFSMQNLDLSASYSPSVTLRNEEKWHAMAAYRHFGLSVKALYNGASFYDLLGPTRVSRKGNGLIVNSAHSLINDAPRTLDLTIGASAYTGLERLPDYQNIATSQGFDQVITPNADLHMRHVRSSLGSVDPEKGTDWRLKGWVNSVRFAKSGGTERQNFPQGAATLDVGTPLVVPHSSLWLRTAFGASSGDRNEPFANFFFGGFGNNLLDYQDPKQYRQMTSFPGVPIDAVGGTDFAKAQLDLNLPPLRFQHLGVLDFYATWARVSVFSTGLITSPDYAPDRRQLADLGAQADLRLSLMIQQPLTLSFGYARAFERNHATLEEWMVSLKILG